MKMKHKKLDTNLEVVLNIYVEIENQISDNLWHELESKLIERSNFYILKDL